MEIMNKSSDLIHEPHCACLGVGKLFRRLRQLFHQCPGALLRLLSLRIKGFDPQNIFLQSVLQSLIKLVDLLFIYIPCQNLVLLLSSIRILLQAF